MCLLGCVWRCEMETIRGGGGGAGFFFCYFLFGRKKNSKLVWTLRVEWRSLKDHSFHAVWMFLPFFCCHWKTHNFSCKAFWSPQEVHIIVRDRDTERETHTHTHPAILQGIFIGGAIPHYCEREKEREREILEFLHWGAWVGLQDVGGCDDGRDTGNDTEEALQVGALLLSLSWFLSCTTGIVFFFEEAIYETDDSMEFFFERLLSVMLLVISANSKWYEGEE